MSRVLKQRKRKHVGKFELNVFETKKVWSDTGFGEATNIVF